MSERLPRLAVIVAAVSAAVVLVTAVALATPALRERISGAGPAYRAGNRIDVPGGVYDSESYTLLLFARSTCDACQRSAPAFKELVGEAVREGMAVRLISAAPVAAREADFARALGLTDADVVGLPLATLRLKHVPTIVVVDRAGAIHYVREGAVSEHDKEGLFRDLAALTR